MFPPVRHISARAIAMVPVLFAMIGPVHAQLPNPVASNIVETVPNIIKKSGAFGTEFAIENEVIIERTPCKPPYPEASARNMEAGTVKMKLLVNVNGFIIRSELAESSGFRGLDRATLIGFLGCKLKPVLKGGVPTEAWTETSYVWNVD